MTPAAGSAQLDEKRRDLLDAAERLFYARGIQAVGMDEIRAGSGLPLKRVYQMYPTKEGLVIGVLNRRDVAWRGRLAAYVDALPDVEAAAGGGNADRDRDRRVLAIFDWLRQWFAEPDFRGCAWINAYGELGAVFPAVAEAVREHKRAFHLFVADLIDDAGRPADRAVAVALLAEGAMVTAAIEQSAEPALRAREAATVLLRT